MPKKNNTNTNWGHVSWNIGHTPFLLSKVVAEALAVRIWSPGRDPRSLLVWQEGAAAGLACPSRPRSSLPSLWNVTIESIEGISIPGPSFLFIVRCSWSKRQICRRKQDLILIEVGWKEAGFAVIGSLLAPPSLPIHFTLRNLSIPWKLTDGPWNKANSFLAS